MSVNVNDVAGLVERIAPLRYACDWDNSGFQVNLNNETDGVLLCLDVTKDVIEEARGLGYGMVLAHHPLLFRAAKRISASDYTGGCILELAKAGISLYSAHTSMDNAPGGINRWMADGLGLADREYIVPEYEKRYAKVVVTVPIADAERVRQAMGGAGAGMLGNYANCSFSVQGRGSFCPNRDARPHIGSAGVQEFVTEERIETLVEQDLLDAVLDAARRVHPYEEPAIDAYPLLSPLEVSAGTGVIGDLSEAAGMRELLDKLKAMLETDSVRFMGDLDRQVGRIAVCGGAGGDFIAGLERRGVRLYVTGEIRHHMYMESGVALVEAGHYDTEKCFCRAMKDGLQKVLQDVTYTLAVRAAKSMKRPFVNY
jgi:dinuclear metal center YbgI/SA1388 family protein